MKHLLVLITLTLVTHGCGNVPNKSSSQTLNSNLMSSKLMLDGRLWTTENLNLEVPGSYCQKDNTLNCRQYGRLYTWEAARSVCRQLGDGWRLPTNEEWQTMAAMYGGVYNESEDEGKSAYFSLLKGGKAGFNALLGGNRETSGNYERLEAHGFYWTATEHDSVQAWFYNFAKGRSLLNKHTGDKNRALSVRCIKAMEN